MPRSRRLFLALWPDAAVRVTLAAARDRWVATASGPLKAVPTASLHLTLHFIGEVGANRLVDAATGLAVPFEPFSLALGDDALWPNGIAALEPFAVPPALTALHARLADALTTLALLVEQRPFRPHVTLARHASGARVPSRGPEIVWSVSGYALIESLRGRGGYAVIATYP